MQTRTIGPVDGRGLALDTAAATHIRNEQGHLIPARVLAEIPGLERTYQSVILKRTPPTAVYNCHGLAFASRRTWITHTAVVQLILKEDRYEEIHRDRVMPGDLILYYDELGEIEHSGIVLTAPADSPLGVPKVYSKWAMYAEVIHPANRCPYAFANARYFRVRQC